MNPDSSIDCRHSAGNLHIALCGDFNSVCAWKLLKILKTAEVPGRVFVNTEGIREMADEGISLFKLHMTHRKIPSDWLYFKGQKGFSIAPNGSRVLISKRGKATVKKKKPKHLKPALSLVRGPGNIWKMKGTENR